MLAGGQEVAGHPRKRPLNRVLHSAGGARLASGSLCAGSTYWVRVVSGQYANRQDACGVRRKVQLITIGRSEAVREPRGTNARSSRSGDTSNCCGPLLSLAKRLPRAVCSQQLNRSFMAGRYSVRYVNVSAGGVSGCPRTPTPIRAGHVDRLRCLPALHHIELHILSILQRPAEQRQVGREMFDCIHDLSIKIPAYAVSDIES